MKNYLQKILNEKKKLFFFKNIKINLNLFFYVFLKLKNERESEILFFFKQVILFFYLNLFKFNL
jgi:hypothetical protein